MELYQYSYGEIYLCSKINTLMRDKSGAVVVH
jgi:hypothetical protein